MWIQVRSMDGSKLIRVDGLSKLTKIEDIRQKLVEDFDAPVERQRLFYRGKLMLDGYSLFDYDVTLNALIQIMVVPEKVPVDEAEDSEESKEKETTKKVEECAAVNESSNEMESTYKLGDIIDCLHEELGAWFEAKIIRITRKSESDEHAMDVVSEKDTHAGSHLGQQEDKENAKVDSNGNLSPSKNSGILTELGNNCTTVIQRKTEDKKDNSLKDTEDDGFLYHILFEDNEPDEEQIVPVKYIRPRARHKVSFDDVKVGERVMVNYNYDEPKSRGYWYDAEITGKRNTRTIKQLTATIYIGKDLVPFENCRIHLIDELFRIEKPGTQLNINQIDSLTPSPAKRLNKPECDHCLDNPEKKCKYCACTVCGDKKDPEKQVLCDECDQAYHIYCLKPPLTEIPDVDEWYCPECKTDTSEVVHAGEKLKQSKKKSKMASAKAEKARDWGKGMACVGRSKQCNIVPPNHFGPIPGVHVGQMWKYRVQVSEAGVHRPHVAGISGRENEGAYSIVLAGGYEDDVDNGEEFTYTGSGGRDLSGNKRTAEQSCDQTLTRMNKALARDCYAPIDDKKGAESKEWRKGKPIRVVRNCKGAKHSKYAPLEGNRYDGIYKVVKYWPDKGLSGFIVWRYLLRRDDPAPAPWTEEGKKRIEELGLVMEYPDGYVEKETDKQGIKKEDSKDKEETSGKKKKGMKRKHNSSSEDAEELLTKKLKTGKYAVPEDVKKNIKADVKNSKLWDEALKSVGEGVQKFLARVEELFQCICCQELVFQPVTTDCSHNICKMCLQRAFKAEVYSCPTCRNELSKDYQMDINTSLAAALNGLYPGYHTGR